MSWWLIQVRKQTLGRWPEWIGAAHNHPQHLWVEWRPNGLVSLSMIKTHVPSDEHKDTRTGFVEAVQTQLQQQIPVPQCL